MSCWHPDTGRRPAPATLGWISSVALCLHGWSASYSACSHAARSAASITGASLRASCKLSSSSEMPCCSSSCAETAAARGSSGPVLVRSKASYSRASGTAAILCWSHRRLSRAHIYSSGIAATTCRSACPTPRGVRGRPSRVRSPAYAAPMHKSPTGEKAYSQRSLVRSAVLEAIAKVC